MDIEFAVGSNAQQTVITATASSVIANTNPNATDFIAIAFRLRKLLIPAKHSLALFQCFFYKSAGYWALAAALKSVTVDGINFSECYPVHAYSIGRLVGHRCKHRSHFILPWAALSAPWCGIGVDRNVSEAH